MNTVDLLVYALGSLRGNRLRTGLMLLAMAIAVAAVLMLTALGEGARRYVSDSFSSLGSHLLIMMPGRSETRGGAPPLMGETPRDLTLGDALALNRSRHIKQVAPLMMGSAPASRGSRQRDVTVLGSTWELMPVRRLNVTRGRFLPAGDPYRMGPVVVLGKKLHRELFGSLNPLGEWIRLGDRRFRVIGVLESMGESVGMDFSDLAIIPVSAAGSLFNSDSLFRILIQARGREHIDGARRFAQETLRERHEGEDDVTLITQDALLTTFDRILRALTYALAGIAAISLLVAGVLIMNIMLVAVSQRTAEIGLLKALGASNTQVMRLFVTEAGLLAASGALCGLLSGEAVIFLVAHLYPDFPVAAPLWAVVTAVAVALIAGVLFGWLPARQAAQLDPVQALSGR
jgi:putative ABC transport system permease protein